MRQNRLIGRQVADRFTIKSFLGEGGMATVFVAEQAQEPRLVALKIMNEDLSADRTFVKRFQREAKAAARVQHPNSVAIIDYGFAGGLGYIAMELLQGDDLYVLLEHEGAISQGRAARILVEVCDALMVAHELGIVHRDLKPENIMVIPDKSHPNGERVKVLDFGIAKLLESPSTQAHVDPRLDPQSAVTRAGTFIGTPAYMSPEQCSLLPVDTRADIYTCGVLLFQLVTGRLPFEGQTPLHTATLHIHEPAPRPSQYAPNIDQRLEAVIMKALAKKPTERHQTARHLASTLRKLIAELPDVNVSKVTKPHPGSMRPSGKTRNSIAAPPPNDGIESARTMVAQGAQGSPPSVVLHGTITTPPPSDVAADSTPARIRPAPAPAAAVAVARPAAGAPAFQIPKPVQMPAPAPPIPRADAGLDDNDDDDSDDSDDSMRTLVRAPMDEDTGRPSRFGPQKTEVIMPASPEPPRPPPAPPPPITAVTPRASDPPALAKTDPSPPGATPATTTTAKPALVTGPSQSRVQLGGSGAPLTTGPKPPRVIKPTLKSASEFNPFEDLSPGPSRDAASTTGSTTGSNLTAPSRKGPQSTLVGVIPSGSTPAPFPSPIRQPLASATEPTLPRGLAPLPPEPPPPDPEPDPASDPDPEVPISLSDPAAAPPTRVPESTSPMMVAVSDGDRISSPKVVVKPTGFADTAKIEMPEGMLNDVMNAANLGGVNPTGATVPLIPPDVVAAAIAGGPRPAAGMPALANTVLAPQASPAGPAATPRLVSPPNAPALVAAPIEALPQTPPVYPLAQPNAGPPAISGTRGLVIGFVAGAVLMFIVALLWWLFVKG